MTVPTEVVHLYYNLAEAEEWLVILAIREGLGHARSANFPCRTWKIEEFERAGYEVLRSVGGAGLVSGCKLLMRRDEDVAIEVNGSCAGGMMRLQVAAATRELADDVCREIDGAFRESRMPREETRVPIHFWTMSAHGPRPMRTMIQAPTWAEIEHNYTPAIRGALARSMRAGRTDIEGVALWRGEPGTGKTTALRALAMEWANWCDVHVIVDPEVFLGDQASYLMDVLFSFEDPYTQHLDAAMSPPDGAGDDEGFHDRYRRESLGSRAKLIVLEDAGELVTSGAREHAGQALSRLLNISDGMLGQGANISVLVTTNEELGNLHPAIQRPGRSWSRIGFEPFTTAEATAWLAGHDVAHVAPGPMSLAELYALQRAGVSGGAPDSPA